MNTDSIRSPIIAASEVINPRTIRRGYEIVKIAGKINLNKQPEAIEPAIPPIKPTRLLFGLAATKPLVFFPNRIPKNQAAESHINTKIRKRLITNFESGRIVILEIKVIKNPQ